MDYNTRIDNVTDESLASTNRMKAYLSNADSAAIDTMANLETQREQLNRVENNLDKIDQEIRVAERNLTQMDKFCGLCLCPCRRKKSLKTYSADTVEINYTKAKNRGSSSSKSTKSPKSTNVSNNKFSHGKEANGRYIEKITGDEREDEMEANMEDISSYLKDLKVTTVIVY